jgi:hypothetical protein
MNESQWAEEIELLSKKVNNFFCFKRKEKILKLESLIRKGSQHYQHGNVISKDLILNRLVAAEQVWSKWK